MWADATTLRNGCGARKYRNHAEPLARWDRSATVRSQPKSSYQELAEGPAREATTTYRRIGKVPSPGRSSCTIREPPFGAPYRPRSSALPRSRGIASRRTTMAIETLPAPVTRSPRIVGMRCRACGGAQPIGLSYVCPACFGPLEVEYDYAVVGATLTREAIAARAPGIWRYAELLPVDEPPTRGLPVGSTPLLAAERLAPELGLDRLWIKDDTRNPSLSFKDRAVAVAAARAVEFGVEALACASTGNLAGRDRRGSRCARAPGLRLHPGRPRAGQGGSRAGLWRDGRPDRRHLRRRQPAVPRGGRRDRLGLRQHQPPPVLRRGLQDARLRDRRVARLALARRRRRARWRRGRCSPGSRAASRSWSSSG